MIQVQLSMSQSSDHDQALRSSECESTNSFNLREQLAVKISSLLQDVIGLPSTLSRENSSHDQWDRTMANLKINFKEENRENQPKVQTFEADKVEIPIKKSPGWRSNSCLSSSSNRIPVEVEDPFNAEKNSHKNHMPVFSSFWKDIFSSLSYPTELDDHHKSLDPSVPFKFTESNQFYHSNNELNEAVFRPPNEWFHSSFRSSKCDSSKVHSSSHDFFNRVNSLSHQIFQEALGSNFGHVRAPYYQNISLNKPCESVETEARRDENRNWAGALSSNYKEVAANPFDGQFFDGAQTELDLYNFLSNFITHNTKAPSTNSVGEHVNQLKKQPVTHPLNIHEKYKIPAFSFEESRKLLTSSTETENVSDRVVSSFHSTTRRLDENGQLHTSVQMTKIYGNGRTVTTTKDYIEKVNEL